MICEKSCDTKDWSKGYRRFSFTIIGINYILKYINIDNSYFLISEYLLVIK